jgi:hypothetical protein
MNPTTKRFARSMSEAFPCERAESIEIPPRHSLFNVIVIVAICALGLTVILASLL